MKREASGVLIVSVLFAVCSAGQSPDQRHGGETSPIYRVTVIERTLKAVNYKYRSLPTRVDFRGTVLMPPVKGEALVESKRGRTDVDAKLENLEGPQRFGREYLTYVLWAITPEGRPHNIGEVIPDPWNKAKLHVTTDLQAFGMMVTAEPYAAVRRPSDVVVAENQIRGDTLGTIEQVEAKYELLPRGQYTWHPPNGLEQPTGPKVSMSKYEAMSQVYQAQNAIGIAQTARADQYAPNTLRKAQELLKQAQQMQSTHPGSRSVVQIAREASQTAEDARAISERREHEEKLANARLDASQAHAAKTQSEAAALRAQAETDVARQQANAERAAREQAELEAANARQRAAQAEATAAVAAADRAQADARFSLDQQKQRDAARRSEVRMRLLEQLNGAISTRDTPRGLVATIPDTGFTGSVLRGGASEQIMRIAAIAKAYPGLKIEVEGHSDTTVTEGLSWKRAEAVRNALVASGVPGVAAARGLGATRPLTYNGTASGRQENRRVEIVISGDAIGTLPFWDRTYSLTLR